MDTPVGVDRKTLERVQKLLNLARDGGATEGEAASAMDRAQEIMRRHGLSIAQVEAAGGVGEARDKASSMGRAHKKWQIELMGALGESSFVYVSHRRGSTETVDYETGKQKKIMASFTLIGRQSAVIQVQIMHDYLAKTVDRMARERGTPTDELFKAGMGERLTERINERHLVMLRKQRQEADEQKARQTDAASGGTSASSHALVVVLEDFAASERMLNEDMRRGVPPGTTKSENEEHRASRARMEAEEQALVDAGFDENVAYWVAFGGMSIDAAEERETHRAQPQPEKEETPEQRQRREERAERRNEEWRESQRRAEQREAARRASPSFRAGRSKANEVGLDTQVGHRETRRIT